jgi:RNA recognition motif-containing protein
MNIYVGNLSFEASEDDLRQAFEAFGKVANVTILKDKFTGKSRGFAFVEMPNNDEAASAISGLNGNELNGRALKVNEALPQKDRSDDRGGRRGGGGGGGRRF